MISCPKCGSMNVKTTYEAMWDGTITANTGCDNCGFAFAEFEGIEN